MGEEKEKEKERERKRERKTKKLENLSSIFLPGQLRRWFSAGATVESSDSTGPDSHIFRRIDDFWRIYTNTRKVWKMEKKETFRINQKCCARLQRI